ncbi:hypothetical protein R3P38DRAFT_2562009 [Favolaschia claudopus]|uniref:Uncharacterized protein n=1 Tax=Favolaschia claudopus TaxID=2862362 RepID=A0AAW0A1Y1_9AGAR
MTHTQLQSLVPKQAQVIPLVTPEERTRYEKQIQLPQNSHLEATSETNFRFDVLGTNRSLWNKSAARVFADLTIRQLGLPNNIDMFQAIVKAFQTYLSTIIRRYKTSLKSADEQELVRSRVSKYGRKYQVSKPIFYFIQLFHRRRYISYAFPPLQKHATMLEQMGIDGMSSDESGDEEDQHEYKILAPQWRATEVAAWLRMFDTIHNILRTTGNSKTAQGAFPHRRIFTANKSKSKKFVSGLPHNTYNQDWVNKEQCSQYVLHPTPIPYDFNHDPNIIQ